MAATSTFTIPTSSYQASFPIDHLDTLPFDQALHAVRMAFLRDDVFIALSRWGVGIASESHTALESYNVLLGVSAAEMEDCGLKSGEDLVHLEILPDCFFCCDNLESPEKKNEAIEALIGYLNRKAPIWGCDCSAWITRLSALTLSFHSTEEVKALSKELRTLFRKEDLDLLRRHIAEIRGVVEAPPSTPLTNVFEAMERFEQRLNTADGTDREMKLTAFQSEIDASSYKLFINRISLYVARLKRQRGPEKGLLRFGIRCFLHSNPMPLSQKEQTFLMNLVKMYFTLHTLKNVIESERTIEIPHLCDVLESLQPIQSEQHAFETIAGCVYYNLWFQAGLPDQAAVDYGRKVLCNEIPFDKEKKLHALKQALSEINSFIINYKE